jgi:hypothetical protein
MAKKGSSKHKKDGYTAYAAQDRCVKNRTARLERHLRHNPDDKVAKAALKNGLSYRRKRGSGTLNRLDKEMMQILASLGYNAKKEMERLQRARDEMVPMS